MIKAGNSTLRRSNDWGQIKTLEAVQLTGPTMGSSSLSTDPNFRMRAFQGARSTSPGHDTHRSRRSTWLIICSALPTGYCKARTGRNRRIGDSLLRVGAVSHRDEPHNQAVVGRLAGVKGGFSGSHQNRFYLPRFFVA